MVRVPLLVALFAIGAAGPLDRVRDGNAAARAGAPDADRHFDAAAERTDDPGLVAFNRGALHFHRGEFREAELNYLRCLDDRAIPPARRRQALYNRGACLLHRDGDVRILRAAITCFEECLADADIESDLAEKARINLELAKVLWNRERSRQKEPPTPNEPNLEEPRPAPKPMNDPGSEGPGETTPRSANANDGQNRTTGEPKTGDGQNGDDPRPAGTGPLPVVKDEGPVQRLTPDDTKALLDRAAMRLKSARRQNELLRAGPERPNVRDW
jgi:hypothetical protein